MPRGYEEVGKVKHRELLPHTPPTSNRRVDPLTLRCVRRLTISCTYYIRTAVFRVVRIELFFFFGKGMRHFHFVLFIPDSDRPLMNLHWIQWIQCKEEKLLFWFANGRRNYLPEWILSYIYKNELGSLCRIKCKCRYDGISTFKAKDPSGDEIQPFHSFTSFG